MADETPPKKLVNWHREGVRVVGIGAAGLVAAFTLSQTVLKNDKPVPLPALHQAKAPGLAAPNIFEDPIQNPVDGLRILPSQELGIDKPINPAFHSAVNPHGNIQLGRRG